MSDNPKTTTAESTSYLTRAVRSLERQVLSLKEQVASQNSNKEVMDIGQAAAFLNKTVPAMYALVNRRQIRFHKPDKKLLFLRSDLLAWVMGENQSQAHTETTKVRQRVIALNKKERP